MFHITSARFVGDILREGLVPGNERSYVTPEGFHRPRADHVYLCDLLTTAIVEFPGPRALLLVDLRELTAERVDPDEDMVQLAARNGHPWVDVDPPVCRVDHDFKELPGQDGALAAWADTTPGFDNPEVTRRSLDGGRIAYRGTVPARAVEVWRYASRPGAQFLATLNELQPTLAAGLGEAPDEGFYMTEVARALLMSRAAVGRASAALTPSPDVPPLEPTTARDVEETFRRAAVHSDEVVDVEAQLMVCAADLAGLVAELGLFWQQSKPTCRVLGQRAAEVVNALAVARGPTAGAAAAREVMEALRSATQDDIPESLKNRPPA
jgi:hypothetical protein